MFKEDMTFLGRRFHAVGREKSVYTTVLFPERLIIIIVNYATQAAHRRMHAQNIETIKHEKNKSTKTKILRVR